MTRTKIVDNTVRLRWREGKPRFKKAGLEFKSAAKCIFASDAFAVQMFCDELSGTHGNELCTRQQLGQLRNNGNFFF